MSGPPAPDAFLLDHFFRRISGRLVAALVRGLGPRHLDLAEAAVQDAFLQALRTWPLTGVPDRPDAWLYRTARNRALDALRRSARFAVRAEDVARELEAAAPRAEEARFRGELVDDALRLMFLCCHPALSPASRVALTLKVAAGFSTREIARAFLADERSIAQRIVRAKRQLRDARAPFEVPGPAEIAARLDDVLDVLYLVFGEGYRPHAGEADVRRDLVEEAIRLVRLLLEHPAGCEPRVEALLALMLFQASRLGARLDAGGALLPLEEQDRALWDGARIDEGLARLARAGRGREASDFHLLAGIAACHATSTDVSSTDWARIVELYDDLVDRGSGDLVRLNRAVAVSYRDGPEAGLCLVEELARSPAVAGYPRLPAVRADLLRRAGRETEAAAAYREAARRAETAPERIWYERQAARLGRELARRATLRVPTPAAPRRGRHRRRKTT
jgi:RNA polymerase sigma-70 factor (ECF subfamily)